MKADSLKSAAEISMEVQSVELLLILDLIEFMDEVLTLLETEVIYHSTMKPSILLSARKHLNMIKLLGSQHERYVALQKQTEDLLLSRYRESVSLATTSPATTGDSPQTVLPCFSKGLR